MNVDKAVQWAQLATLVIALALGAATCSRGFDRIADHEKRLEVIENGNKAQNEKLGEKLQELKDAVNYMNWRMDGVTKAVEAPKKK